VWKLILQLKPGLVSLLTVLCETTLSANVVLLLDKPWQDCCGKRDAPDEIVKSMTDKLQDTLFQAAEQQNKLSHYKQYALIMSRAIQS
jgi:hypothetical protein